MNNYRLRNDLIIKYTILTQLSDFKDLMYKLELHLDSSCSEYNCRDHDKEGNELWFSQVINQFIAIKYI